MVDDREHDGSGYHLARPRGGPGADAQAGEGLQNQLVGLVALAAGTAVEAGLAVKKARSAD